MIRDFTLLALNLLWIHSLQPQYNLEFVFLDEQNKQSYTFIAEDENGKITDLKECSKFEIEQNLVGYKFKHVREFPVF